jgi:hypothetical protein
MAAGAAVGFTTNMSHKLFLQAVVSHRIVTEKQLRQLYTHACHATGGACVLPKRHRPNCH